MSELIGQAVFIRRVDFYYVGRLVSIEPDAFVLDRCSWIPDTGSFHEAMRTGVFAEVEPWPADVLVRVGRAGIADCSVWMHPLPTEAK